MGWPDKYKEHILNLSNPVFDGPGSGIANLLGLPMTIRSSSHRHIQEAVLDLSSGLAEGALDNEIADKRLRNLDVLLLQRDITSTTTGPFGSSADSASRYMILNHAGQNGFGDSPVGFDFVGPVYVARADGLPLLALHIKALCSYIKDIVNPRLAQAVSETQPGQIVQARESVLDSINKTDFMAFYNNMRDSMAQSDLRWAYSPSPYEIASHLPNNWTQSMEEQYQAQIAESATHPN
jgi:hypothetical protein